MSETSHGARVPPDDAVFTRPVKNGDGTPEDDESPLKFSFEIEHKDVL